ncbi:hypothetical protein DKT77_18050 [Meridianimarinicoccus roseus]|uniref:Uncharacterized protein n=1 Tax=Meridianimarinicoccus roseus TaxID=2072018 RepID=A0A2V2LCH3_9RHOB|nr:hypothetical protein [Meridianimarinicoccus roseus]PWR01224.1 hypothetical protein DKT77_18050 [Meridianimarinicoccus roseus]
MTLWIGTNQVGWDANSIGFHSLNGCTALVLMTDHWLAGWHVGGGSGTGTYPNTTSSKVTHLGTEFLTYIRAIGAHPWPGAGLGVMAGNLKIWIIYNGGGAAYWQAEITDFANLLGFHGQGYGFDLLPHVGLGTSCDVIFDKVGNTCQIRYKKTAKMAHVKQTTAQMNGSLLRTVYGSNPISKDSIVRQPATKNIVNEESDSAAIIDTGFFANRGQMHTADQNQWVAHNV